MIKEGFGLIGILVVVGAVAMLVVGGVLFIGDKDGITSIEEKVDAIGQAEEAKNILQERNKLVNEESIDVESLSEFKSWTASNYFKYFSFKYPDSWETGNGDSGGSGAFWVNPQTSNNDVQYSRPRVIISYKSYADDNFSISEHEYLRSEYIKGLSKDVDVYKNNNSEAVVYRVDIDDEFATISAITFYDIDENLMNEFVSRFSLKK